MEIAIGIAGLLIAWFTYQKTFLSKPKEEKENLLANFRATQVISKDVLSKLQEFGTKHNAFDEIMFCKIPLGKYIEIMRTEHRRNLSDELYETLRKSKLTKPTIESMMESLMAQQADLIQVQTAIKMHLED